MESTSLVPPPVEVSIPLQIYIAYFTQTFQEACPTVSISVVEETEFGIIIRIGDIYIFCARHCSNPAHSCIMVSIGTTIVPYKDQETTPDYIHRVVALVEYRLNLHALSKVCEVLPSITTLHVVIEKNKIQIMIGDFTPDSTTATIKGGRLIDCGIPLRTDYQPKLALMAQLHKLIEQSSANTVYVRIQATQNGFVSLHEHEGEKFIFLSNNQGVSTKIDVKSIRLFDMENFLKKPTNDLVVIHTSCTPFSGVVGQLEFSCANSAIIKVDKARHSISTGQWSFLKNIIEMF